MFESERELRLLKMANSHRMNLLANTSYLWNTADHISDTV